MYIMSESVGGGLTLCRQLRPSSRRELKTLLCITSQIIHMYIMNSRLKWYEAKRVCCDATAECGR